MTADWKGPPSGPVQKVAEGLGWVLIFALLVGAFVAVYYAIKFVLFAIGYIIQSIIWTISKLTHKLGWTEVYRVHYWTFFGWKREGDYTRRGQRVIEHKSRKPLEAHKLMRGY